MSREWTDEEIRDKWLKHVWSLIELWEKKAAGLPPREILKRFAFSLMSTIDGTEVGIPGFILAPRPHPDDKQFCVDKGENYYPENDDSTVKADIGGELHDLFHSFDPGKK